ncbi:MAG: GNAT family N-acetyltransferase [Myxococcales bacterium]|nr:GNAT family N-acetyltransferase [Myxococcales bacterium]
MGRGGATVLTPTLRHPTPEDAPGLARIEARAWEGAYAELLPASALAPLRDEEREHWWRRRIESSASQPRRFLTVACRDSALAGYVSFGETRQRDLEPGFAGEIYELYVDPDHQRQSVGKHLFDHALQALRNRGRFWCVLDVLRDNDGARAFYEAMGMQTDGRLRRRSAGTGRRSRTLQYRPPPGDVVVVRYEVPLHHLGV